MTDPQTKECMFCHKESLFGKEHEDGCIFVPKCKHCLARLDVINTDDKSIHAYACQTVPKCKYCLIRLDEEYVIHRNYCRTVPKCDQCMARVDTPLPEHKEYCLCITKCASCEIRISNAKEDCEKNNHLDTCISRQDCPSCKSVFKFWETVNGVPKCILCGYFYID